MTYHRASGLHGFKMQLQPAILSASVNAAIIAGAGAPPSIIDAECQEYKYVNTYKPVPRTGIVPAGTPIVAAMKVKWDPSRAGSDFPQSWLTWRGGAASQADQVRIDTTTRANKPGLPATSTAFLTGATQVFLLGMSSLGDNVGVLYAGVVSTKDVDMEPMQFFAKSAFKPQPGVRTTTFPVAYGVVPPGGPAADLAVSAALIAAGGRMTPVYNQGGNFRIAYPGLVPGRSVNVARQIAVSNAIAMTEGLQILITGGIFGGLAIGASQTLFIPGEREVIAAQAAVGRAASLADLPAALTALAAGLVQEAGAAKSLEPAEGDRVCAEILARLSSTQTSVTGELNTGIAALSAGAAALAGARAAAVAYAGNAGAVEGEVRRKVAEKIAKFESRESFASLAPGEKKAIRCMMQKQAAPLIASRAAVAEPRAAAMAAIDPAVFASQAAAATAAYEQALASVNAVVGEAVARVEAIRKQIALAWYARSFHGLPVWAWGAGGAALLVGGAVAVRVMRKKKAPAAIAAK